MRYSAIAATVVATGLLISAQASAEVGQLPQSHTQGSITYLSGGIGKSESDAIKSAAPQYPLELEFLKKATPKDEYLADIKVEIKDAHNNTILDTKSDGPFLLAQMPQGSYTISADDNGQREQRQVNVSENQHRRIVFEWR